MQSDDQKITESILDAIEFNHGGPLSVSVLTKLLVGATDLQAGHRANRNYGSLRAFPSSEVRRRIEEFISGGLVEERATGLHFEMYPDDLWPLSGSATSNSFDEKLNAAKAARNAGNFRLALELVKSAMEMNPKHQGAAAVASSIYRAMDRPKDAMRVADKYWKTGAANYIPLLTSRAAALLDMESLAKARKQVDEIRVLMDSGCEQNLERQDLEFLSKVEARLRWKEEQELKEYEDSRQPEPFPDRFY